MLDGSIKLSFSCSFAYHNVNLLVVTLSVIWYICSYKFNHIFSVHYVVVFNIVSVLTNNKLIWKPYRLWTNGTCVTIALIWQYQHMRWWKPFASFNLVIVCLPFWKPVGIENLVLQLQFTFWLLVNVGLYVYGARKGMIIKQNL